MITRRRFILSSAATGSAIAAHGLLPSWAHSATSLAAKGITEYSASEFHLHINQNPVNIDGVRSKAVTLNGTIPAPLLRWQEGETVTLHVHNHLEEDTSIHWHGILLPYQMDGVPGISFAGIKPKQTFTYQFPVRQAGTYWYHSHSGLQEQIGHYGPIIIDPANPDPVAHDREYVLVLSDWTFLSPQHLFLKLKQMGHSLNYQKRTVSDLLHQAQQQGWKSTIEDRAMWGQMRMNSYDIADVGGETYTYLVNGHGPNENWTGLFKPGEKVRLRIINASAMTIFNLRIPGMPMSVVQADGIDVQPVETDEFQIGVAETYDVVVQPKDYQAYTVMCESIDRSGYTRATLTPEVGLTAPVPKLRKPPTLTMKDMGMAHHNMAMDDQSGTHNHQAEMTEKPGHHHHTMADNDSAEQAHDHLIGPGVVNVAMNPVNRLDEPGLGLENVPHRTLAYTDLKSLHRNQDCREPEREIELHLTSNMERYMWSFDGEQFSEVVDPIVFYEGERLRLTLVNDTMMSHPIHLHGMFFQLVNGHGDYKPNKHTITVKPAEKLSVDITADAVGDWAFHCHLLYHMHAGMFRIVSVKSQEKRS